MNRWVLERNGLVRGYLFTALAEPSDAEKRRLCFGDADATDDEGKPRDFAGEGTWRKPANQALLVGDGWTWNGTTYAPPVIP